MTTINKKRLSDKKLIKLSIIIVNYNGAAYIGSCIDSIKKSNVNFEYEIIVVDNNSYDTSKDILKSYLDDITLIENKTNNGFSKANNQGLAKARGEYVFLLNNDTLLELKTLETLMQYYIDNPDTGAVAPKLLNKDSTLQAPGSTLGKGKFRSQSAKKMRFISGAAFFTTKKILDDLKGLDENFFFYNEDIDLCLRIRKFGKELIYLPQAALIHFGGEATKTRKAGSIIEGYRGGLYLCYKHYGWLIYTLYRILLLMDVVPKIIWYLLTLKKEQAGAYLKILIIDINNDIYLKR
jgi:GT2 family glycosyltransferase